METQDRTPDQTTDPKPDADYAPVLEQTLEALQGGVTALSPDAAAGTLDRWIAAIAESGKASQLGGIAGALGQLRNALTASPLDGANVVRLLHALGQQTTNAAAQAGDYAPQLQRLGQLLTQSANALGGPSRLTPDGPDPAADPTVQVTSNTPTTGKTSAYTHGNQGQPFTTSAPQRGSGEG